MVFTTTAATPVIQAVTLVATAAMAATAVVKGFLDRPSRVYSESANTVGAEYDAWTADGVLEYYWGEHIHLGYYSEDEMRRGYTRKNFIQAKYDFIDEMMKFGGVQNSPTGAKVLDVGCGFGGTSRYLARKLGPSAQVEGITLSPKQVERGTEMALEQGVDQQVKFKVMDALNMTYADNSFDVVWACESGEHMPDKAAYINEMMRVLKPGGTFVMACWCQRDETPARPFDKRDKRDLRYLYEEWTHPYFISISDFAKLIDNTKVMNPVTTANWVKETIASWRHSVYVGIVDPRGWIFKPRIYLKCVRDGYCLERMHRAFKRGLMEYGMFTATKKKL
jgi:MPBQ/MSBQ methyltransferase